MNSTTLDYFFNNGLIAQSCVLPINIQLYMFPSNCIFKDKKIENGELLFLYQILSFYFTKDDILILKLL